MKYLTPERYLRLGNLADRRAFQAAHAEWEQALLDYRAQRERLRPDLPPALVQLNDSLSLHDAQVLDMWWGGRSQFTITLLPASDPSRLVVLTYSLVGPPGVTEGLLPETSRTTQVAWLYDELGREGEGTKAAFTHSILLSDGREVTLPFRSVTVKRPTPFVPVRHSA